MNGFVQDYKSRLFAALDTIPLDKVEQAIVWLEEARDQGRRVFICGNGGSAASASHIVCDMVKGASYQRDKKFKMMALNDSLSTLTAYSNDVGYEVVFVEPLKNFGEPGDILIAVSGSGNSPNVLRAIEWANENGLKTIGLTGRDGGRLGPMSQLEIRVADPHMGRIEDGHMTILHMIGYYFMEQGGGC
jgi:D-sedoheptulose 7-phosphate isomerase